MSNPQSGYEKPSVIPLTGGLDIVSSRFFSTPGTLQDCLNYETYSVSGYSVVEGIARYDGSFDCYSRDWVVVANPAAAGTFITGEALTIEERVFGTCIYWDGTNKVLHFLISDVSYSPKIGDKIVGTASLAELIVLPLGISRASEYYSTMAEFLTVQSTIYSNARSGKQGIFPYVSQNKNLIAHGLHWFNGKLYSIVDHYKIQFKTGGPNEIQPGDHIRCGAGGAQRDAIVLDLRVSNGSWSASTASGYMLVKVSSVADNTFSALGAITLIRPNGATGTTTIANAAVLVDYQLTDDNWGAGIYYALADNDVISALSPIVPTRVTDLDNKRWNPLDMGWEIAFRTDSTTTGPAIAPQFRDTTLSSTATPAALATASLIATTQNYGSGCSDANPFGLTTTTQPAAAPLSTTLGDGSDLTYVEARGIASGYDIVSYSSVSGFNASFPSDAIPTGIRVTTRVAPSGTGFAGFIYAQLKGTILSSIVPWTAGKRAAISTASTAIANVDIGGITDLWGLEGLTVPQLVAVLTDPAFGLTLSMQNTSTTITDFIRLYGLTVTIFYRARVTGYFAFDPVTGQDLSLKIPYFHLFSGTFNPGAGTAGEGVLVAYDVNPLDSAGGGSVNSTLASIKAGWELRTARSPDGISGGGSLIAIFSSQMKSQLLPCRKQMFNARSQFEIITANYYANRDWISIYGVSGIGPAFTYDNFFFYKYYTELTKSEDTPRHICYHRNHNCLGYENGQVIVSIPGEPINFDSVAGSTQYAIGDRLTNLLSLNGTALAIFGESSIHALTGTVLISSPANDANMQILSPYSGAIEYTAVDCGVPLYADYRGISTIEASQKYGDFENGRVSYLISPLLHDRVSDRFAFQATAQNILFARAVRNKNQYRLYCADGKVITCSLPMNNRGYEFTTQQYSNSSSFDTLVPITICNGVSRQGRDLLFGSFHIVPDDPSRTLTLNSPDREMFIYAMDTGTQFDTAPIKHVITINWVGLDSPVDHNLVRRVNIQMLNYNYFNEYIQLAADYGTFNSALRTIVIDPATLPPTVDKQPSYTVTATDGRGVSIAIRIGGEHSFPGHVLQALVVHYISGNDQLGNSPTQKLT